MTSLLAERDACYIESKRLLESIEESQAEVTRINHLMNELERHREGIEERILKSKERESVVQTACKKQTKKKKKDLFLYISYFYFFIVLIIH